MVTIDNTREAAITRASLVATLFFVVLLAYSIASEWLQWHAAGDLGALIEGAAFAASVSFLIYGSLVYQWCRLSYYRRRLTHQPAARDEIEQLFDRDAPSLTVLVPSYREEPRVVLQTLLSAAFTEYPQKSIVLLIDDPPDPSAAEDRIRLRQTRRAPEALNEGFEALAARYRGELAAFICRTDTDPRRELHRLAGLYAEAAHWIQVLAADALREHEADAPAHADAFFDRHVIEEAARRHLAFAQTLRDRVMPKYWPDRAFLDRHYRRLAAVFDVRFSAFERKQYVNLSHEPNKAMNLNTYIGLMGHRWREVACADGVHLRKADGWQEADVSIADPDYLITLDADSVLLPDYALRLIHLMEQPAHRRVAIAQTPYSAFPGAPGALERLAGATTDLQYIVHQGFTGGRATYWVGANALIRRRALDAIAHSRVERGHTVLIYIQDRTLIEDTESSIDLIRSGWDLYNYPERLAYSATPPDFGALLIQRRRWANGGLLILAGLATYAWRAPKDAALLRELALRFHYLASLAGASVATLLLFFYPFDEALATVWAPLTAIPYFVVYARDLRLSGYRSADVLRVYALNLALVPVILGGVLKSIQQGVTGAKIPFGRTPKVSTRSPAPPMYCAIELVIPVAFAAAFTWDAATGRWSHAAFALLNGALFVYALVYVLGLRETVTDLRAWWTPADRGRAPHPVAGHALASPRRRPVVRAGSGRPTARAAEDFAVASRD